MENVFAWWVASTLLGLLAVPYAFATFTRLPDRGVAFARPFGLLLTTYLMWVASIDGLIPNGRGAAMLATLVVALGGLALFRRHRPELLAFVRTNLRTLALYEAVFLLSFVAWAVIRAYNPQLDSTEKPMDLAMLTSTTRSLSMPPLDPWLSGFTVNYYYFGYLLMAVLNHLAGTAPYVGFNLALAFLFSSAAVAVMGLVANLVALTRQRPGEQAVIDRSCLRFGLLAVAMLLVAGNLVGVLELLRAHGFAAEGLWRWVSIKMGGEAPGGGLALLGVPPGDRVYQSAQWYPTDNWWWWRATRVIDTLAGGASADYTITEFPFFSFLLGDLHPHVMSLPFVLLAVGVCLQVFLQPAAGMVEWVQERRLQTLVVVLLVGSLGFINGWDLGPYLGLLVGCLAIRTWLDHGIWSRDAWVRFALWAAAIVVGAVLAYGAFYAPLGLQLLQPKSAVASAAGGGGPLNLWGGPSTRPLHFVIFWFMAVLSCGGLLWALARRFARRQQVFALAALGLPVVVWVLVESWWLANPAGDPALNPYRGIQRWWLLGPLGLALVLLVSARNAEAAPSDELPPPSTQREEGGDDSDALEQAADGGEQAAVATIAPSVAPVAATVAATPRMPDAARFVVGLVGAALTLLLLSETVYVRDVFGNRMNTVFKLYYQAWTWLAVAGAFGIAYVAHGLQGRRRTVWRTVVGAFVALGLVYPLAALPSKTEAFAGKPTLNGLAYLDLREPWEYDALVWLSQRPTRNEVVLEASGGQYSFYGRASTVSGIPSVLGWAGHEVQWRGNDPTFKQRLEDIEGIFLAPDKNTVKGVLERYKITYIYVGSLETAKYPSTVLASFRDVFTVAYQNQGVTIYRVNRNVGG